MNSETNDSNQKISSEPYIADLALLNTLRAQNHLAQGYPYTAKTANYQKMVAGFMLIFVTAMIGFVNLFNIFNHLVYLLQNIFKTSLFMRSFVITDHDRKLLLEIASVELDIKNLPIYTVFVPLYKEARKLKSIASAIDRLNYPKDKLDVKFILEDDDTETLAVLATLSLPSYIQVIKVPFSLPRTKPKAMNYATGYIRGEYLCIFDAEDEPHPDQLLKALQAFAVLPSEYSCVQARLNYYNANENLLTKFFSLEYSLWFDHLLKALSRWRLPIPLGGTSNHFKVDALQRIRGWDSYNVTEDAELGARLALEGYKIYAINSITLEESPVSLGNWFWQRVRWIKGFIQTIYSFILIPNKRDKLKSTEILSIYMVIGFSSYGFLCMPWLVLSCWLNLHEYIYYLWILNTVLYLSYLYYCGYYVAKTSRVANISIVVVMLWPCYFILHTIAAYWAIGEILFKPFKWNKTEHGVSEDISEI